MKSSRKKQVWYNIDLVLRQELLIIRPIFHAEVDISTFGAAKRALLALDFTLDGLDVLL